MALEPMKGNQASSRVDLGNTELFPIPAVTSVSFWTSDFMESLCLQCKGIGPHLVAMWKSHGFSQVAAETWGTLLSYSRDGHFNSCLFSDVRTPV